SEDSLETREKINHNKLSTQLMRVSEAKIQLSEPQNLRKYRETKNKKYWERLFGPKVPLYLLYAIQRE
ncbi:MAG: hypothetical protein U9O41_06705, partial [Candidatus Aerophobetes bacterium]|nr:hypothetical protein [Candidatus Aerophobetes bacterium]